MNAGIDCYTSQETINHLKLSHHRLNRISNKGLFTVGNFKIMPFNVVHNLPCMGFLVSHSESGKILFITDAAFINHKFSNISHLLLECNYSDDAMVSTRQVGHHMELSTALDFIQANSSPDLRNVVLLHLSATNSNERKFVDAVKAITPHADVVAADKGVTVNLNRLPF